MAPLLAYWDVRGIVTPIRLLLSYADAEYDFKAYNRLNVSEWFKEDKLKFSKTFDFPNLPYYIDQNVKLTHINTILGYLAKKFGLDGTTEEEKLRISLVVEQVSDFRAEFGGIAYPPSTAANLKEVRETLKKEYAAKLPGILKQFSKFLGQRSWIAGERLTYADFCLYDALDMIRSIFVSAGFDSYSNLVGFMKRVEGLPRVGDFIASKVDRIPNDEPKYASYAFFWNNS